MVEGTYSNGDGGPSANPFGFDSFGNSLAGPGQQSQKPPRSQHPPRMSLVGLLTLDCEHIRKTGIRRRSEILWESGVSIPSYRVDVWTPPAQQLL